MKIKISFLGGGNISRSLISSCIQKRFPANNILVSDPNKDNLNALVNEFGIVPAESNKHAAKNADILVLAVKPQIVSKLSSELLEIIEDKKPLVISLAAGVRIQNLEEWFGVNTSIVRTMTNICTKVGMGNTALFANKLTLEAQREMTEYFFNMAGSSFWVGNEEEINKITPIIGCGPAFLCLLLEAMEKATISLGISPDIAKQAALASVSGAVCMLEKDKLSPGQLRTMITTPNGVTDHAIKFLLEENYLQLFEKSFQKAENRGNELGNQLSQEVSNSKLTAFFNNHGKCNEREDSSLNFRKE